MWMCVCGFSASSNGRSRTASSPWRRKDVPRHCRLATTGCCATTTQTNYIKACFQPGRECRHSCRIEALTDDIDVTCPRVTCQLSPVPSQTSSVICRKRVRGGYGQRSRLSVDALTKKFIPAEPAKIPCCQWLSLTQESLLYLAGDFQIFASFRPILVNF